MGPLAATLDLQRRAIADGMTAVAASIERTGAAQQRALERSRRRVTAAIEAVEPVAPGAAVARDAVEGTVDGLLDTHAGAVDALVADCEAGAETTDRLFEASVGAVKTACLVPPADAAADAESGADDDADAARRRISEVQKRAAAAVDP